MCRNTFTEFLVRITKCGVEFGIYCWLTCEFVCAIIKQKAICDDVIIPVALEYFPHNACLDRG